MAAILSSTALVLVALNVSGLVPLGLHEAAAWAVAVLTLLLQGMLAGSTGGSRG